MSWLFLGTGALMAALGIPLIRRRVRPNPWYGLRVPATLEDEDVWFEANARSGRDLVVLGILQIIAAASPAILSMETDRYVALNVAVLTVGTLAAAGVGWTRANRLRRQRRGKD